MTDHVPHHVERRTDHGRIGAEAIDPRHGYVGALQPRQDAVLAAHVVGAGEHVPERRAAEHESGAVGRGDGKRQVRVPAGDEVELERAGRTVDVPLEPRRRPPDVETGDLR